jgi:hypothetical protein
VNILVMHVFRLRAYGIGFGLISKLIIVFLSRERFGLRLWDRSMLVIRGTEVDPMY